jgi:hypothetical protein
MFLGATDRGVGVGGVRPRELPDAEPQWLYPAFRQPTFKCKYDQFLNISSQFSIPTASRPALHLTQGPTQWVPAGSSPVIERPAREVDGSPPSSAEAKNDEATAPLAHTSPRHCA